MNTVAGLPRYSTLETAAMVVAPVAFGLVGLFHPLVRGDVVEELGRRTTLWLAIHIVQIPLTIGAAVAVSLVVKDLPGRAAAVSRIALVPFVAFYSAFDAVVGIATGLLVRLSGALPSAGEAARVLWNGRLRNPWIGAVVLPGDLAWVIAGVAAAIAVRQARGPRVTVVGLVLAAVLFGIDHAPPVGPAGMTALAIAAWACAGWRNAGQGAANP